ncbi:uncharacterized protein TNCT_408391 [Trichonephila clavata]|uniref:Uncharacterized protein n=1 Tax=Trichonephila clavata TaxID=2740835 RepID=A0A8X6KZW9_TRICU|nr:uncharacterized protein TNCT_408391 [Trichonephila clavata]
MNQSNQKLREIEGEVFENELRLGADKQERYGQEEGSARFIFRRAIKQTRFFILLVISEIGIRGVRRSIHQGIDFPLAKKRVDHKKGRSPVTNDDCVWGRRVRLMTRSPLITIINNGQALTRPRWDHTPSPDRASRPDIRPPSFSSASRIEGSTKMRGSTTNQQPQSFGVSLVL